MKKADSKLLSFGPAFAYCPTLLEGRASATNKTRRTLWQTESFFIRSLAENRQHPEAWHPVQARDHLAQDRLAHRDDDLALCPARGHPVRRDLDLVRPAPSSCGASRGASL